MYNVYPLDLFKQNKVIHKEIINNLCVLFSKHNFCCIELPNNKDANLIIKANLDLINEEINDKNQEEQVWNKYLTDIVLEWVDLDEKSKILMDYDYVDNGDIYSIDILLFIIYHMNCM